jgi:hypothetical protein
MGRAPVSSGTYVTGAGGYTFEDGDEVLGYTISNGGLRDVSTSAEDGWHGDVSLGTASGIAGMGGLRFNRIEAFFTYGEADDGTSDVVGGADSIRLKSVDGTALARFGDRGSANVDRRSYEGGLRFASDQGSAANSMTWVLTPFLRFTGEESDTRVFGSSDSVTRSADVDTWMYGLSAAVEPEIWVSSTVALVGRVGVGVYGYDADGDFRSAGSFAGAFDASVSDNDTGVGFRGQLGAGVKLKLGAAMHLTGYAEADYFSAVGRAEFADNDPVTVTTSRTGIEDAWEVRTGARLSIGLGGN